MKITNITPSQKVKERFYVDFDDGTKLVVTTDEMAQFGLYTGMEPDSDTYSALKDAAEFSRVKSRALRIISARPMSQRELTDKLKAKGETQENADAAAQWLTDIGVINDGEYAHMIVRHYSAKGWGPQKIRSELFKRGVSSSLWDEAFEELPESSETIDRVLQAKLRGSAPDEKDLKKLTDMLRRRGFAWNDIRSALARYSETMGDMEDEI